MRVVLLSAVMVILSGCSDDPDENFLNTGSIGPVSNIGNSFVLLSCFDAAEAISSSQSQPNIQQQVELGMSAAEIRSIAGKPRHIKESVWTFGYDLPVNIRANPLFDWVPTTTVTGIIGTTAFSGDNTLCTNEELAFIQNANNLINNPDTVSHRNEIPNCETAAVRIAAKVELGMSPNQVRDLVGRPVEITPNGLYRYKYGQGTLGDGPLVQFGDRDLVGSTSGLGDQFFGDTEETGISNVVVTGYWSPILQCDEKVIGDF